MWACSSVVEHCVDIAGVASSILATPTIFFSDLAWLFPSACRVRLVQLNPDVDLLNHLMLDLDVRLPPLADIRSMSG